MKWMSIFAGCVVLRTASICGIFRFSAYFTAAHMLSLAVVTFHTFETSVIFLPVIDTYLSVVRIDPSFDGCDLLLKSALTRRSDPLSLIHISEPTRPY